MCQALCFSQCVNELRGCSVWEAGEGKPSILRELGHPAAGRPGTVTLLHTLMTAQCAGEYSFVVHVCKQNSLSSLPKNPSLLHIPPASSSIIILFFSFFFIPASSYSVFLSHTLLLSNPACLLPPHLSQGVTLFQDIVV